MATILVVDNNPLHCLLLEEELEHDGYQVTTSDTGRKASELAAAAPPDLVVLDLMMPGMDGIELLGRFRALYPQVPIVIHTGYSQSRSNFLTWAADAYVLKQPDFAELKETMARLLGASASVHAHA